MRRRLFNILAAVSLGLLLILWMISYFSSLGVWVSEGQHTFLAGSDLGIISFEWEFSLDNQRQPWGGTIGRAGATREGENWWWSLFDWTMNFHDLSTFPNTSIYFAIPHWGVMAAFAVLLMPSMIRRWKQHIRSNLGLCLTCGYNLTGNISGVCPECGTAIPARPANAEGASA